MANPENTKESALATIVNARRSTRVFQAIPLSISGQNRTGSLFLDSTSAVSVNCHGCLYPSRYEYRHGSWVTIEVPDQQANSLPRPVRAQVKFIRLPRNPNELYLVGVELEKPSNVWGIKASPEDWLQFSESVEATATAAQSSAEIRNEQRGHSGLATAVESDVADAPGAATVNSGQAAPLTPALPGAGNANAAARNSAHGSHADNGPLVSAEHLLHLLDSKLEQAAERAVAAAVNERVNAAVNEAVRAIENFSQASVRQVEAYCGKYRESMMTSAREELLARLQADLFQAGEALRKKVDESSIRAHETVQQLERGVEQVKPIVSEAQALLEGAAREVQNDVLVHMRDSVQKAGAEFDEEAARLSQRQLARLSEKSHAMSGEAARALESRSVEARAHLDAAAATALAEFHQRAGIEIDMELTDARRSIGETLESFAAETSAAWEARKRACEEELASAADRQLEDFRKRLAGIVNSSMLAAISAVSEHSVALLDSLSKEATEALRPRDSSANSSR